MNASMTIRAAVFLGVLALAGCASPDPVLYRLAPVPGPTMVAPLAVRSVELRRVGLPGYLDRPGIVRSATDFRIDVTANSRWAAPLGAMLDATLAENLAMRLPGVSVFTEANAISIVPDRVVKVDIVRL